MAFLPLRLKMGSVGSADIFMILDLNLKEEKKKKRG
jgi:hypothetical protein